VGGKRQLPSVKASLIEPMLLTRSSELPEGAQGRIATAINFVFIGAALLFLQRSRLRRTVHLVAIPPEASRF
jgi:hypothetical protein